ncbi:phytanoyl-CoA dioxygenase domain-containing protein [Perkinsela sp. CCAP 1560/4]|nr:phytanoyl-CoA dioxygenase domain-containing protein [Perkinsela sp. CCAP 1560/4]|eukprot:KNH06324.1 phytanoyl-CoA dioxygenase domain-containing protein [Perkinsela sp. CCAP 1560/4]
MALRKSLLRFQSMHQLGVTPMWKRGRIHKDLKEHSGPTGFLFGNVPSKIDEYIKFALSEESLAKFAEQGWIVTPRRILSRAQIEMLHTEVTHLVSYDGREDPPNKNLLYNYTDINPLANHQIFYSTGHWRIMRCMHDLVYFPTIAAPASQLLGNSAVQFLHDEMFCKPPMKGSCVVWHQNGAQWRNTFPLQHISVHIALDNQTRENGGLCLISGSHKWRDEKNLIPMTVSPDPDPNVQMRAILETLEPHEKQKFEHSLICPEVKLGHALFIHPLLLHGSYPNQTTSWRRSAVIHYCAKGTSATATGPLFRGTYVMRGGEPLTGNFYPIVFDPQKLSASSQTP